MERNEEKVIKSSSLNIMLRGNIKHKVVVVEREKRERNKILLLLLQKNRKKKVKREREWKIKKWEEEKVEVKVKSSQIDRQMDRQESKKWVVSPFIVISALLCRLHCTQLTFFISPHHSALSLYFSDFLVQQPHLLFSLGLFINYNKNIYRQIYIFLLFKEEKQREKNRY